jgi:phosphate acyltransferase
MNLLAAFDKGLDSFCEASTPMLDSVGSRDTRYLKRVMVHSTQPESKAITIAVDAMGGHHAPAEIVGAVCQSSLHKPPGSDVFFALVGDQERIGPVLGDTPHNPERIRIVHQPHFVTDLEPAGAALLEKPNSSIAAACRLVASGEADALVTAGNPQAAVLAALDAFELLASVEQPALAAVYPTPRRRGSKNDRLSLLLDVGATLSPTASDLVHFAIMGSAYARIVSGNADPRVALLSTSRAGRIGTPTVVEAHQILQNLEGVTFCGNIEGHDIPAGDVDVVVCEGVVGDVAIKLLDGVSDTVLELARSAYESKMAWRMGLRLLSGGLRRLKQRIDFEEYGGAPLLGVDQVVIVAHPESGRKAIINSIKLAIRNVRANLVEVIDRELRREAR